jgi:peptidoglycan-associated lipoprotein
LSAAQKLQQTLAALPNTVYFGFDKYNLNADGISVLQQNAAVLLQNPSVNVMLAGNTDPIGSQEYNFHLGMKRAQAVYNYLLAQGIPAGQLCTVSYGELKPNPAVDQSAVAAAKGHMKALIAAYAPDRNTQISYNQTCQGASTMSGS